MSLSMTGFGRGEARARGLGVAVEVKSVNHRYFEAVLNLPSGFWGLEAHLKQKLRAAVKRGHLEVCVNWLNHAPGLRLPVVDIPLARQYAASLRAAGARLRLPGAPDLRWIANLPGVVRLEDRPARAEALQGLVDTALTRALGKLRAMRQAEGRRLSADMRQRMLTVRRTVLEIQKSARRRNRQLARRALRSAADPAAGRRGQPEGAANSARGDITEEVVRLLSHLAQMRLFLRMRQPVGRRLDFLLQEMNREANTIGAKAGEAAIVHRVVAVKEELEKIREQTQNLE